MSKEPIYRIKVEVIGEETENCKLNEAMRESVRGGVDCNGFVILGNKEGSCSVTVHGVSNIDIATMISHSGDLMAASLIAQAMREGNKYLHEDRNPLVDILKAMSK